VNPDELTGRARTHVVELAVPPCILHAQVAAPFLSMRGAARAAGFDLTAVSSFRDFDRQIAIWNGKFSGEKPTYDAHGLPLDVLTLSPTERVAAILLWSALPGASRHHWGTDVDLIDAHAIAPGFRVELTGDEFAAGGPFAELSQWLERHAAKYGFFRPYQGVLSGVRPEPWHYSFAPDAAQARRALTPDVLRNVLAAAPLLGREQVLDQIDVLHARYVAAIDWP
jgi:LAS superfamily LD-carboxypeptidase LdcB